MTTKAQALQMLSELKELETAAMLRLSEHEKNMPQPAEPYKKDPEYLARVGEWENEKANNDRAVRYLSARILDLTRQIEHHEQAQEMAAGIGSKNELEMEETLEKKFRLLSRSLEAARQQKEQSPDDPSYQWLHNVRDELNLADFYPIEQWKAELEAGKLAEGETI